MTFVGLVVPGIPTVPFLLASSYYLARSSRTLHKRLLESRLLRRGAYASGRLIAP